MNIARTHHLRGKLARSRGPADEILPASSREAIRRIGRLFGLGHKHPDGPPGVGPNLPMQLVVGSEIDNTVHLPLMIIVSILCVTSSRLIPAFGKATWHQVLWPPPSRNHHELRP